MVASIDSVGVTVHRITPEQFGFQRCPLAALRGGNAQENAVIVRAVLGGEPGPRREVVLLNAGYALVAAGKVVTVPEGIELAAEAIDSGRALRQLEQLVRLTNS